MATTSPDSAAAETRQHFADLVQQWKQERDPYTSRPEQWAMCWPYQKIIAMGPPAVPLILEELRASPDHWFWALCALTGEDPVPPQSRGVLSKMTEAWIA